MDTTLAPNVRSITNLRDLGGYDSPYGKIHERRFLRCGATASVTRIDLLRLRRWGVRLVLDLRSEMESPRATCVFSRQSWVRWCNVGFYDVNISAPTMVPKTDVNNYLVTSYLHMLAGDEAVRAVFSFMALADKNECVLFHCAAGMDRTGMVAMLLLGLAEVPREEILADYCYSFANKDRVDATVHEYVRNGQTERPPQSAFESYLLYTRLEAIATVYDTLVAHHGSVRSYLESCKVPQAHLEAVLAHLVEE